MITFRKPAGTVYTMVFCFNLPHIYCTMSQVGQDSHQVLTYSTCLITSLVAEKEWELGWEWVLRN